MYTTQQPSNGPTSYLSVTRRHARPGRDSEFQTTSAVHQDGDGSVLLPHTDIEEGSIYAGRKRHGHFLHTIEDTNNRHAAHDNVDGVSHVPHPPRLNPSFLTTRAGVRETLTQNLSSEEDLTGDFEQNMGKNDVRVGPIPPRRADSSHEEFALLAGSRNTNPNPALTSLGHPEDRSCTAHYSGSSTRITPKTEEGEDDGIPFSIKKSFKELRSVKDELERQRGENERLRAELAVTQKKASDALARLSKTKLMTKRSIESTSNTLVELRKELALLKSQSDESFAFAAQARSDLPVISDLRLAINKISENCHCITEDLGKAAEMKGLIRDLGSECANARKANDFLRDKLTDVTSQYVDATERLQDEERTNTKQTDALRAALDDLHNANLLAVARTAKLDATQKELSDALTGCALAMENIFQLEKREEKLTRDAEEKALVAAALQKENAELHALLTDRESSTSSILSLKEEILAMLSSSSDQQPELDTLRTTSAEQLQTIGELNERYRALERECEVRKQELANQISENAALRADREAANDRERLLSAQIERLKIEKSAVETQSQTLRDELRRIAEERKQENDRMTQLQMRCHALQERFEDQSVTLKLARESHGDIQERLIAAEAAFTVKLEAETGKLRQEVFSIEERNGFLQRSVDEHKRQLEEQKDLMTAMRNEYEKRLEDERDGANSRIQELQERVLRAGSETAQAVEEADGLRDSLTSTQSELTTLREQVRNIQPAISELDDQVKDLTGRNHALQAENVVLHERGNTIWARYDANDLVSHQDIVLVDAHRLGCRVSKKRSW
ncbi:hypothetical protein BC827DRAFT_795715 [Russula dissimulans]|nr:hypothetical protein BC827DRAFT_795715 [Russula dissimulans]